MAPQPTAGGANDFSGGQPDGEPRRSTIARVVELKDVARLDRGIRRLLGGA